LGIAIVPRGSGSRAWSFGASGNSRHRG